jgi:hypothetical protein
MTKTTAGRYRGRRPVLVGVDGSVSAQGALAWAAAEASYRHCPLQIVHAFTLPTMGDPVDLAIPPASTGNHGGPGGSSAKRRATRAGRLPGSR